MAFYTNNPPTVAKTTTYTILEVDNGTTFTNAGAGGAFTFTLPQPSPGFMVRFINEAGVNLTVQTPSASPLLYIALAGSSRTLTSTNGSFCVRCSTTGVYFVTELNGVMT